VPEIKSDSDIRSFYGNPSGEGSAHEDARAKAARAVGTKSDTADPSAGNKEEAGQNTGVNKRQLYLPDLMTFWLPFLPFGFVMMLKQAKSRRTRRGVNR
jgi:hypothetical protein